ncbi:hypothetical protein [Sphingomonas rubra]|uniref:Uncharacterized protein n=1 Tax=Sphingomonas rubra TaxID=634430 RepID=A0A1I5PJ55_9SPHN|nr:hypothetical protein [Sphingomonas rubra]SFP33571.1 hypothetical protein SAMN04488241_10119 [Sphingomonas rubra]
MSLLIRIDHYLRATATPATKFGRMAVNDPRLVADLRRGRRIGQRVRDRVEALLGSEA